MNTQNSTMEEEKNQMNTTEMALEGLMKSIEKTVARANSEEREQKETVDLKILLKQMEDGDKNIEAIIMKDNIQFKEIRSNYIGNMGKYPCFAIHSKFYRLENGRLSEIPVQKNTPDVYELEDVSESEIMKYLEEK